MSSMGYEVYEKDDTVYIKRGGRVQMKVPFADFNTLYKYGATDKARARQLRAVLKKYRDTCTDKEELKKELKSKLGVDIVFFGKKDQPYGYILVDHSRKMVFHGARVLAVDELLDFALPQERFDRIEAFIDDLFTINPKITQNEIYDKLWRQHAYIKKGVVYFNGQARPLKQFLVDALARNSRVKWVESFHPMTEAERDFLCKAGKGADPSFVSLSSGRNETYRQTVTRMKNIFADAQITNVKARLGEDGFVVKQDADNTFAINFSERIIINLTEEGFDLSRLIRQKAPKQPQQPIQPKVRKAGHPSLRPPKDVGGGSQSEKREWEVGYKGDYDRIDDGQSLKM